MIPWRNLRRFFFKAVKQPKYAFNVLLKRLKAEYYYNYGNGESTLPESVTFFLTHRCNLNCKMCGQWGESGVTKKHDIQYIQEELSIAKIKEIIDEMSFFKPSITLFGGEPLLYEGCIEVIKYIKEKGMHCLMITNGFLLKEMAKELVDNGLDELNVSLDGDVQIHDQIRGMPGLFSTIMEGLKRVAYIKKGKGATKPLVNIQCTISKYNYCYLERLIAVAKEAEADSLTFHNLIFLDQRVITQQKVYDGLLGSSSQDWEGFVFEPGIKPELLYDKIHQIVKGKHSCAVDFYPNFSFDELKWYYEDPFGIPCDNSARCLSPWLVSYIFPDGEVRPCLNSSYSFGNIKNNKFLDIWNSHAAINYRRFLKSKRLFPVCMRCTELYRY